MSYKVVFLREYLCLYTVPPGTTDKFSDSVGFNMSYRRLCVASWFPFKAFDQFLRASWNWKFDEKGLRNPWPCKKKRALYKNRYCATYITAEKRDCETHEILLNYCETQFKRPFAIRTYLELSILFQVLLQPISFMVQRIPFWACLLWELDTFNAHL